MGASTERSFLRVFRHPEGTGRNWEWRRKQLLRRLQSQEFFMVRHPLCARTDCDRPVPRQGARYCTKECYRSAMKAIPWRPVAGPSCTFCDGPKPRHNRPFCGRLCAAAARRQPRHPAAHAGSRSHEWTAPFAGSAAPGLGSKRMRVALGQVCRDLRSGGSGIRTGRETRQALQRSGDVCGTSTPRPNAAGSAGCRYPPCPRRQS